MTTLKKSQQIVQAMRELEGVGLNQGSSGNISVRDGARMLITPTGVAPHNLNVDLIVSMDIASESINYEGAVAPSSEWPFHRAILQQRDDVNAIIHVHAPYVTTLAVLRRHIPAVHYMIAAFGGPTVKCTDYAPYGSADLSDLAVKGLGRRHAVLLGNHGAIVTGASMERALWRAIELEALARTFYLASLAGDPVILSDQEIAETVERFEHYGIRPQSGTPQ